MFNSQWWTTWGDDEEDSPNRIPKSSGRFSTRAPNQRDSSPEEEIPQDLERAILDLREELAYKDKRIADLLAEECPRCMNSGRPSTRSNSTFGENSVQPPGEPSKFNGVRLSQSLNSTDPIDPREGIFQWMSRCLEDQPTENGGQYLNSNNRGNSTFHRCQLTASKANLSNIWKRMGLEEMDPSVSVKWEMVKQSVHGWMDSQQPRWLLENTIARGLVEYIVDQTTCATEFSGILVDSYSIRSLVFRLRKQHRKNMKRLIRRSAHVRQR